MTYIPDWLCTLAQVRAEAKVPDTDTSGDSWIVGNIPDLAARLEAMSRLRFNPYIRTYKYNAFGTHIDDTLRQLDLGRPILLPTEVIDAFGNHLVFNTDYVIVQQDTPGMQFELISNVVYGWSYGFGFGTYFWIAPGQFLRAISVTGIWGYGMNYPDQWRDSLQAITTMGGINSTARTFAVTDPGGVDSWAQEPAISQGSMLQLVDTSVTPNAFEWMQVLAVDETSKVITVLRGINGSTAQAWPQGAEISTWMVQPEINRAAYRWLGYWYSRRGAYEAVKSDLTQGKTMIYPGDAPTEILNTIAQTRDWSWGAV